MDKKALQRLIKNADEALAASKKLERETQKLLAAIARLNKALGIPAKSEAQLDNSLN